MKVKINKHYCNYYDHVVSNRFFPKIAFPTCLSDHSSTLIDNIFANNMVKTCKSGILLNNIFGHQMIFTYVENVSYITEVLKFIDIERGDDRSIHDFVKELNELNIYDQLQSAIDSNPQDSYDTFITLVSNAKNKHLPKKLCDSIKRSIRRQGG